MNRLQWFTGWLRYLHDHYTSKFGPGAIDPKSGYNINLLGGLAWIDSEGSLARNNPLDCERTYPGSTDYNPQGVKNYASLTDGYAACAESLYNGYYPLLIKVMLAGNDATNFVSAIYHSAWGSKPTITLLNNVRANYVRYASVHVAGAPTAPPWEVATIIQQHTEVDIMSVSINAGLIIVTGVTKQGHKLLFMVPIATRDKWTKYGIMDLSDAATMQKVAGATSFIS